MISTPTTNNESASRSTSKGRRIISDDLLTRAQGATGLDDWGSDPTFRDGLDKAVESMNGIDHVDQVVEGFKAQMIGLLSTRLRLVEDEKQHPEILEQKIERPVILIGPARSGTTILHDLLALDPAARAPLEWETANPWPAPDVATWTTDPRIAATDARLEQFLAMAPVLRSLHPWGATLPSDCLNMLALHFTSASFVAGYSLDSFSDWLATESMVGQYRTHRRVLQQLQWKGPKGRWTLKEPTHQQNLDLLFAAYPDACYVQTHREPANTIPSAANLIYTIQAISKPDRDRHDTGRTSKRFFGNCLERSTAVRNRTPALDARVLDVAYADTVTDPVGQVRRIHEHFDLEFSAEHARRIEEHMHTPQEAGQASSGSSYRAEDYGLDRDELLSSFPEYRQRFSALLAEPVRK